MENKWSTLNQNLYADSYYRITLTFVFFYVKTNDVINSLIKYIINM
jgi:hypothetical protein